MVEQTVEKLVILDAIEVIMKSIFHSQTLTVAPLKLVLEWISNSIPQLIMDVITYPCWDLY